MSNPRDNINVETANSAEKKSASIINSQNISEKRDRPTFGESKTAGRKSFSEKWKTNRFWLVRGSYYVFYSVWMVAMFIGGFIAWLISLLFI